MVSCVELPAATTFSLPGTFDIARAQRYVLVVTVQTNNLVLLLVNEGPLRASAPQALGVAESALSGQRGSNAAIRFAPAGATPARR